MRAGAIALVVFVGCSVQPPPVTPAALCTQKAAENAAAIATIAAQQSTTVASTTEQFVSACTEQVEADMNDTAAALLGIALDGGAQEQKP